MGRQVKGLLYFFTADSMRTLAIFWGILSGTLLLNLVIAYFLVDVTDTRMLFIIPFGTYIFCAIFGFVTVKQCIPFAIKMGATRKNIYASIGIFFLLLAIFKAVLSSTMQSVLMFLIDLFQIKTFSLVHPAALLQDTWLTRIVLDASMMVLILTIMFFVGLIFYRFGLLGGGVFSGVIVIVMLLGLAKGTIFDVATQLYKNIDMTLFYQISFIAFLLYVCTWIFIRKITVHGAK
ncbi:MULTISPECIES: hypothetical protein [unclassified Virgibacillus]|uniref:hypothetical protein n=1 Tax=unclassified Virgibacillus TaxID=2620237 RepID=UPI0024DE62A2|nr:hypothetical protein [Virgibacillus sp. LDC-1]